MAEARNPFPGMNPYLEDPALWGDVHHTLISAIRRQLPQPLPRILIPLLAPDPDVEVHLQAALEEAYEEGQYHQIINYAADCPAPLPSDAREWVQSLLREKGLRE